MQIRLELACRLPRCHWQRTRGIRRVNLRKLSLLLGNHDLSSLDDSFHFVANLDLQVINRFTRNQRRYLSRMVTSTFTSAITPSFFIAETLPLRWFLALILARAPWAVLSLLDYGYLFARYLDTFKSDVRCYASARDLGFLGNARDLIEQTSCFVTFRVLAVEQESVDLAAF